MLMEMCMKDNEKMIKHMAKASTIIWMGQNTKGIGLKTSRMALELKFGKMAQGMKGNMIVAKKMEWEIFIEVTDLNMKDNSIITIFMVYFIKNKFINLNCFKMQNQRSFNLFI